MVKDPTQFTFNADAIRVPSARQLVYGDKRANPVGRLPDDTWILRPQDLPGGFQPDESTWYFPRVAGTFKERAGWHGCQMPEQLLGRIIRACSHPGELVFDPFGGSGTTAAVARKLGRDYLTFEFSPEYAERIRQRLHRIKPGDPLDGSPEPLVSAPDTSRVRRRHLPRAAAGRGPPDNHAPADKRPWRTPTRAARDVRARRDVRLRIRPAALSWNQTSLSGENSFRERVQTPPSSQYVCGGDAGRSLSATKT
jgi:hypothetical protein